MEENRTIDYKEHLRIVGDLLQDYAVTVARLEAERKEAWSKGYMQGLLGEE